MALHGKLTRDNVAHTMPVDVPSYQTKPFYYKSARVHSFVFKTDSEAAASLIPMQLKLTEPASASLMFFEYPWSTIGTYKEATLAVNVTYEGEPFLYLSHLILDSTGPILVGREVYGLPKKMGVVKFAQKGKVLAGYVERPRGVRICSEFFEQMHH